MSEQTDIYREHMMHARISSEQEAYQAELARKRATPESSPAVNYPTRLVEHPDGKKEWREAPVESPPADGVAEVLQIIQQIEDDWRLAGAFEKVDAAAYLRSQILAKLPTTRSEA